MTKEQYEQGKEIYSNLNECDSILANIEGVHISGLFVYGKLPSGKNYKSCITTGDIITSNELSNFIIDKVKKRKIELESELAKI